jgi:glycosyltransferase involved in cell wall biosynthesis/2-polyprenyl-3-methyl-5-hydroxy-6-metoxy-1,4-benzoquinol methylase
MIGLAEQKQLRLLVFIVSYHAERTIEDVLVRIPKELSCYDVEILLIDDASSDATFDQAHTFRNSGRCRYRLTVLANPVNQGYGGNQKIGYFYASQHGFDVVALVHGDGQYAPEKLPELMEALVREDADAMFGSRFLIPGAARAGGMPLYKYVGNRILSHFQNALLGQQLSEFHSGYRLYRVAALESIPYMLNTPDFHFDTEIIIQLLRKGKRICEHPIPTYYGDEICYVEGLRYAWNVAKVTCTSRLMDLGLLYQVRFDVSQASPYEPKLDFESSHTVAIERVPSDAHVLDIGCGTGTVGRALKQSNCTVVGIDAPFDGAGAGLDEFHGHDLATNTLPVALNGFTHVVMLDVIEHMPNPEGFVQNIRRLCDDGNSPEIIVTTGNVSFIVVRLMLLFGAFNYGARGILDKTHTRLFTYRSVRDLFEQRGFEVLEVTGIPAPFPLALGRGRLGRGLLAINRWLIRLSRGLFAYQVLLRLRPLPSLPQLLASAQTESSQRLESRP